MLEVVQPAVGKECMPAIVAANTSIARDILWRVDSVFTRQAYLLCLVCLRVVQHPVINYHY